MLKKGLPQKELKLLVSGCAVAMILSLSAMLCLSMLIKNGVIGAGEWDLQAKLALVIGSAGAAVYVCLRIKRDRVLLTLISNVMSMAVLLCASMLLDGQTCNYFTAAMDILIGLITGLLVCLVASKSTKHRKHKKMHK